MSSVSEQVIRLFADQDLTKEAFQNNIDYPDDLVLLPGEEKRLKVWVRFEPFKPTHIYQVEAAVAEGDAKVTNFTKKTLKAGEIMEVEMVWTGRTMSLKDLEPLSASLQILGRLIAPAR